MISKFAFVFPGQGSQTVGMLAETAKQFPIIHHSFEEASNALSYDLWDVVQNGPEETLNQTLYTQPAMLAAGVAVYRAYRQNNEQKIALMAGHSLGEYTALVCADSIKFVDAIQLVHHRARLMQETMPQGLGAMAAIVGLDEQTVTTICEQAAEDQIVSAANFNAIGQTVIAGHTEAIDRAIVLSQEKGAKLAMKIPVSVPCHCQLLAPAAQAFAQYLTQTPIQTPAIPVLSNVTVEPHQHPDDIRKLLQQQLYSPVRWVDTISRFKNEAITDIIECGPGRVLTGLIKRIDRSLKTLTMKDMF